MSESDNDYVIKTAHTIVFLHSVLSDFHAWPESDIAQSHLLYNLFNCDLMQCVKSLISKSYFTAQCCIEPDRYQINYWYGYNQPWFILMREPMC